MATPSNLVAELKSEHQRIVAALDDAKKAGVGSAEWASKVGAARTALLAHLSKEDAELYPTLREAAKTDGDLAFQLRMNDQNLRTVVGVVAGFYELLDRGTDSIELSKAFGGMSAQLSLRIASEESQLYATFERVLPARR